MSCKILLSSEDTQTANIDGEKKREATIARVFKYKLMIIIEDFFLFLF
jgi:hypothetical protein